jgi:hypothetical protein
VDSLRRLLEDLEEGVGGLLHHVGGGEDEDLAQGLAGQVVGALNEGADLAELDEELGWVGRQDEDVGVGLNEDASLLLVGLAELFSGGDGGGDLVFEVGGGSDADAVGAVATEACKGLSVGPEVAWLALALNGHGKEKSEGILSGACWAGEDDRMREASGGDGCAQGFDGVGVAEELIEVGWQGWRCGHG